MDKRLSLKLCISFNCLVSDQGPPSVVMTSHKNETHEEKQQRKKAVKEERRVSYVSDICASSL